MTDAEIIKVLEICLNKSGGCISAKCPFVNDLHCKELLISRCFEIINRQQAEIERFKEVKHGRWIRHSSLIAWYECSECNGCIAEEPHYDYANDVMHYPKYCEHCGAKMEMDNDD